jgi:DNA polymerase/3'-5' exonuclease PolX
MTNKEIAKTFQELADIMELHQENPFKIKTYLNAYIALRKVQTPLAEMSLEELTEIKGVGKAVSEKIQELIKKRHLGGTPELSAIDTARSSRNAKNKRIWSQKSTNGLERTGD